MAENTLARNAALPYPIYGVPFAMAVPILDADGDGVTSAADLDCEIGKNGDTPADIAGTEAEIGNGQYLLTFTAADMTADVVSGTLKTSTAGAKNTHFTLYPRKLITLSSGTSQGGDTGYITLAAGTVLFDNQFSGCVCVATIDGVPQVRILGVCTASNQQCAVSPAWTAAPDADDTYVILLPEGMRFPTANVKAISDDATAADILELFIEALKADTGQIDDGTFAAAAINAAAIADAAIDNATFAADVGSTAYATNIIALAVRKVLDELNLDHLLKVADADDVVNDSVIGKLASTDGDWSNFVKTTDSLQSLRDKLPANLEDLSVTDTTGLVTAASVTGDVGGKVLGGGAGTITGTGARADLPDAPNATALTAIGAKVEAMVFDEADATALLAAIAAKIETFLINEGDATATLAAIGVAVTSALGTGSGLSALATAAELAKVPKSDSNVTWNATALGSINAEVDTALNTAIPGTPTPDSINERVATMDGRILGTITAGTHTAQSGDSFARLGAPTGASVSADIAAIDGDATVANQTAILALLLAQREIDTTTTPWQLVLSDRTTGAELYRFDLTDANGDGVAAIDTFVAGQTTPA